VAVPPAGMSEQTVLETKTNKQPAFASQEIHGALTISEKSGNAIPSDEVMHAEPSLAVRLAGRSSSPNWVHDDSGTGLSIPQIQTLALVNRAVAAPITARPAFITRSSVRFRDIKWSPEAPERR
jgi:hypothetical protein